MHTQGARLTPRGKTALTLLCLGLALCGSATAAANPARVLEAARGHVTYVDFWASWCGPCAESFPWLNAMHDKYAAQGLRIVGVGVDTEAGNADRFLLRHPARFDVTADPGGTLAETYGVENMPYAVLLDAEGKVLYRHSGFRAADTADYEQHIRSALAAEGALR
jgi:thiol-disulfide isomerase/thioredoxin